MDSKLILIFDALILFIWMTFVTVHSKRIVCVYDPRDALSKGIRYYIDISRIDPKLCTHLYLKSRSYFSTKDCEFNITNDETKVIDQYKAAEQLTLRNRELKIFLQIPFKVNNRDYIRVKYSCVSTPSTDDFLNWTSAVLEKYKFHGVDLEMDILRDPSLRNRHGIYLNILSFLRKVKADFKTIGYLLSATFSDLNSRTLDEGFNWEEHYDFINIQPTRCRDQVLSNLNSEERQYINYTMPDDQKIVSSLTDECEKDSVNFVSPLRTRLNQINLQVPITGLRWDEDDRHSIIIPYPKMCRSFPDVVENLHINRRRNEKNNNSFSMTRDNEHEGYFSMHPFFGLYGKFLPYEYHGMRTHNNYISYTHPLIVMAKVKHAISAGFGGVLISNILEDDFDNACGNGNFSMMNAIFQSIETINESEKTEKERQKGKERQSKASLKKSEERDSFDSFMERGGVVLKLCFALLLLGAVSHAIYWPIYFFQNKNRVVRGKTPSRNNN